MRGPVSLCDGAADPRLGHLLRALCTPTNLILGSVLLLGWIALIAWTGSGTRGWQARLCADLDAQPRACAAVQAARSDGQRAETGAAS